MIRLGIVGCGNMGGNHNMVYGQLEGGIVTATVDVAKERAEDAARMTGAHKAATDYRDILDDVDALLIALPHDLHYETGMTCLKAGKHVLMEKPLANSESECLDLIHTAKRENKVLMTAYPIRYHPLVAKMKELIVNKTYGEVFQVSIFTEQFTKKDPGHWILSAKRLGGGQFFSHGCHYVDLMLDWLGKPVKGSHIGTNLGTPWMEKEGTSNVILEFENGKTAMHFGTWGARGTKLGYNLQAFCTEGTIELDLTNRKLYVHHGLSEERNQQHEEKVELLMESEGGKYTQHEINHFLHCVRTGETPLTNGHASLQGLRVIWRLYEAEQMGVVADLRGLGLDEEWDRPGLDRLPDHQA